MGHDITKWDTSRDKTGHDRTKWDTSQDKTGHVNGTYRTKWDMSWDKTRQKQDMTLGQNGTRPRTHPKTDTVSY